MDRRKFLERLGLGAAAIGAVAATKKVDGLVEQAIDLPDAPTRVVAAGLIPADRPVTSPRCGVCGGLGLMARALVDARTGDLATFGTDTGFEAAREALGAKALRVCGQCVATRERVVAEKREVEAKAAAESLVASIAALDALTQERGQLHRMLGELTPNEYEYWRNRIAHVHESEAPAEYWYREGGYGAIAPFSAVAPFPENVDLPAVERWAKAMKRPAATLLHGGPQFVMDSREVTAEQRRVVDAVERQKAHDKVVAQAHDKVVAQANARSIEFQAAIAAGVAALTERVDADCVDRGAAMKPIAMKYRDAWDVEVAHPARTYDDFFDGDDE